MSDRSKLPPISPFLLARIPEMLALPWRACCQRNCRRRGRCCWVSRNTQQPFCLRNLDAGQRAQFGAVAEEVRDIVDYSWFFSRLAFASPYRDTRALQDAGMAVARTVRSGASLRDFGPLPPCAQQGRRPSTTARSRRCRRAGRKFADDGGGAAYSAASPFTSSAAVSRAAASS